MSKTDFIVKRDNLNETTITPAKDHIAAVGEAVLTVERFALTANNITYGVAGDTIGYWKFFPTDTDGWGSIPVWGIAKVTATNGCDLKAGARYYGYFPMSSELKVKPIKLSPRGFVDGVDHRSELPPVYNQYTLVNPDNGFQPGFDNHKMVYAPLFTTSFVLDDFFLDNQDFGAQSIILGSASSKTAFGMAYMLKQSGRVNVVGLTSARNLEFVKGLELYNDVFTYDEIESINNSIPSAYVDMSGNREVLSRVHHHLKDKLVQSCAVGITHWESRLSQEVGELPGAKPTLFFAPSQIVKRNKEWGPAEYQARLAKATDSFLSEVDKWVTIEEFNFADITSVYNQVLVGAPADKAVIVVAQANT